MMTLCSMGAKCSCCIQRLASAGMCGLVLTTLPTDLE